MVTIQLKANLVNHVQKAGTDIDVQTDVCVKKMKGYITFKIHLS